MPAQRQPALLFRHPAFYGHDTTPHPENPHRIQAIDAELTRRGLVTDRKEVTWDPAHDHHILAVHDRSLLQNLLDLTARGGGAIDPDTPVLPDSLSTARLAAGASIAAVDAIRDWTATTALVLGRPPGHHATHERSMGFCLINTVAIAAQYARSIGFERVAIIDWDVHHGNGTQDIFYRRSDVLFCSVHRYDWPFFPGTGMANETGSGPGSGFTVNVPLATGAGDKHFISALEDKIAPRLEQFRPDLILLSAGYDAHIEDPLGGCRVTDEGFQQLSKRIRNLADRLTEGRLIVVLEGGYQPRALARCVADIVEALDTSRTTD